MVGSIPLVIIRMDEYAAFSQLTQNLQSRFDAFAEMLNSKMEDLIGRMGRTSLSDSLEIGNAPVVTPQSRLSPEF